MKLFIGCFGIGLGLYGMFLLKPITIPQYCAFIYSYVIGSYLVGQWCGEHT